MTIDCIQLRDIIIKPSLSALGLLSDSAVNLILGTAAVESEMGKYIVQNGGPAVSIYQIEPRTYSYIWDRHIENSRSMKAKVKLLLGYDGKPQPIRMASDLILATVMARLIYANVLEKLPESNDIKGMARYYKIYFNTMSGKSTEEKFIEKYNLYIK